MRVTLARPWRFATTTAERSDLPPNECKGLPRPEARECED